ncbi:MAG: hypothetical protein M0Q38_14440 [Bacteroidales bacterium]|jgi:hypothetical protein|nr:hypothetical protein [Bacteroidales bacterium]
MKNLILLIVFSLLIINFSFGQGVAISDQSNAGVSTGAVLDVSSSSGQIGGAKGFLPPRIASEKYAVSAKSDGLMYYFTDTKSYGYWTTQGWCSFVISGPYQGEDIIPADPVVQNVMFTPLGGLAVKLSNKTGSTLSKGMLVKVDSLADNAVKLASGTDAMGVVYENILDNADGWIVISGIAEVLPYTDNAPIRGNRVRIHDSQPGYGNFSDTLSGNDVIAHSREIGYCIKSAIAGQLARVVLQF